MTSKKIIAVVGSTGAQGGGLARAVLDDPDGPFTLRALTRDPSSDNAMALAARGAEVVQADVRDEASLVKAFDGAHSAFLMTNFWEHMSPEQEKADAGRMALAAKSAGLHHVIWSTIEDTRDFIPLDDDRLPTLLGRYKVPHCDAKAEADRFFTEAGVPTTFLRTAFYWENLLALGQPQRQSDGRLATTLPIGGSKIAGIAVEDIGRTAYAILKRGEEFTGRTISIAGEHLTGAEIAAALSGPLGEEVLHRPISADAFRALGFPGAMDNGNMFQFFAEVPEFVTARNIDSVRAINPSLQTFEQWLEGKKGRFTTV
ncbi:NmrA/HSCARG family protein [Streptomyces sp. GbtcB7]|uniref:NmrA/HSCARG family protein n=1 Tax=Streptomyces sp. GbtcB7 TaxID=2824752 RepID=UPI001C2F8E72|nr:NmrA/HSCARG family protein [Streptomyces sp. GbtcB7]